MGVEPHTAIPNSLESSFLLLFLRKERGACVVEIIDLWGNSNFEKRWLTLHQRICVHLSFFYLFVYFVIKEIEQTLTVTVVCVCVCV